LDCEAGEEVDAEADLPDVVLGFTVVFFAGACLAVAFFAGARLVVVFLAGAFCVVVCFDLDVDFPVCADNVIVANENNSNTM
jgi:hypothetical protein